MKKRIIQIRDHPSGRPDEKDNALSAEAFYGYELVFEDGSFIVVDSKDCDGYELKTGDEIFVYDEVKIISRVPISPQKLQKIAFRQKTGMTVAVIVSVLLGITAALIL